MSKCIVVLDGKGDYHATVYSGLALTAAQRLVKETLSVRNGEVFHYVAIHECDSPLTAMMIARGRSVEGQFIVEFSFP